MKKRMTGGRFLIAAIILAIVVTVVKSYGMNMGGFDVEVGDGSYEDGNFQGWEEPPPEQMPSEPIWQEELPPKQIPSGPIWREEVPQEQMPPEPIWHEQPKNSQSWEATAPVSHASPTPTAAPTSTPTPWPIITPTLLPTITPTPIAIMTPRPTFTPVSTPSVNMTPTQASPIRMGQASFSYYKKREAAKTKRKDYSVKFINNIKVEKGQYAEIDVESKGSVQILSLRVNEREWPWHWEENKIVIDGAMDGAECKVEILAFSHGGKLIKIRF